MGLRRQAESISGREAEKGLCSEGEPNKASPAMQLRWARRWCEAERILQKRWAEQLTRGHAAAAGLQVVRGRDIILGEDEPTTHPGTCN